MSLDFRLRANIETRPRVSTTRIPRLDPNSGVPTVVVEDCVCSDNEDVELVNVEEVCNVES